MKKVIKCFGIFLLILILVTAALAFSIIRKQGKELAQIQFSDIDMSTVSDGTYIGSADTTLVKVGVEVTVCNGKMQEIHILKHENGLGRDAEKIIDEMIEQNSYDVDAISGATVSSTVIKKAVLNALQNKTE